MASPINIVGAAVGLHALALTLLGLLEDPPPSRDAPAPLEVRVIERKAEAPAAERPGRAAPARRKAPTPQRARRVASASAPPTRAAADDSRPPAAPVPEPPVAPAPPAPGSDEAVLLGAIGQAGRNDKAQDGPGGDGGEAGRAADFLRGGTRGGLAPPHESHAAPAAPVEDYTRLIPRYTDAAILHDASVSASLRVEVDETGRVVDARILKSAGYGLDEVALETVRKYRFKPALDDEGRPIRSTFGWRISWASHWRRLMLYDLVGHPSCRGQGPLNLGSMHAVYIDCDGPDGYFDLDEQ